MIALRTTGSRDGPDRVPAGATEIGMRIDAQRLRARDTIGREHGSERQTTPSKHVPHARRHAETVGEAGSAVKVVALQNGVIYEMRRNAAADDHTQGRLENPSQRE